ncbi:hypothetical protein KR059_005843, partial [Drosophila kikkawai]
MPTGDEKKSSPIPSIRLERSQSASPRPSQLQPKAATTIPRAKSQEAVDTSPGPSSRLTRSVFKVAQSELDIALRKFISTTDRVSHFESNIHTPTAPETDRFSPAMCQVHREQIRALWDKVEKSYESCSDLLSVSSDSTATATVLESKYSDCYSVYSRCLVQLQEIIDKAASQSIQASAPAPTPPSMGCRLPPVDTEVFAGDYLRWPTFRDLFTAIYIHNSRLTPVEKLFHLLSKTSGDAHAIVSKAPLTNEGFISACKAPSKVWDCLLVYMVSLKLPKITLSRWEKSIHNKAEIPTWSELDAFLTERHRTLEAIDDIRPSSSGQFPSRPTAASAPVHRLNSYEARVAPAQEGAISVRGRTI